MKEKYITTLVVALLFISGVTFSQVNTYFLHNPVWTVISTFKVGENCLKTEHINYYPKGDTLISGFTFKKIFRKEQGSLGFGYTGGTYTMPNCSGSFSYIDTDPSYFLRSQDKKMYLRQAMDTAEYLLYDFNLQVGDSLPQTITYNKMLAFKVTAIDSIYTSYGYRKRFKLNNGESYLYEGIGSSSGLTEYMGSVLGGGYGLECFSLNDTSYLPKFGPTCNIAVGIRQNEKQTFSSAFPNPFSVSATIEFSSILESAQLNIYNHLGQKSRTLNGISGQSVKIEREALDPGIYSYEVLQDGLTISTGKLVVID